MNLQAKLLAVVPRNNVYTAYFFCAENRRILPLEISSETSSSLIACEQKVLFDFYMNFQGVRDAHVEVSAKLYVEKDIIENYGIKVTRKMLEKCVLSL